MRPKPLSGRCAALAAILCATVILARIWNPSAARADYLGSDPELYKTIRSLQPVVRILQLHGEQVLNRATVDPGKRLVCIPTRGDSVATMIGLFPGGSTVNFLITITGDPSRALSLTIGHLNLGFHAVYAWRNGKLVDHKVYGVGPLMNYPFDWPSWFEWLELNSPGFPLEVAALLSRNQSSTYGRVQAMAEILAPSFGKSGPNQK